MDWTLNDSPLLLPFVPKHSEKGIRRGESFVTVVGVLTRVVFGPGVGTKERRRVGKCKFGK